MVTVEDLVHLPYTPDLTSTAITYLTRQLPRMTIGDRNPDSTRLRQLVAEKAVELAFRRYLYSLELSFHERERAPFTTPDEHEILLRGQRCLLETLLIGSKKEISRLRNAPDQISGVTFALPEKALFSERANESDCHIFSIVFGLIAGKREDMKRAYGNQQPLSLLFLLPSLWSNTENWNSLGALTLKAEASQSLEVEIGGMDCLHQFQSEMIGLSDKKISHTTRDYYTLTYMKTSGLMDGRMGIFSKKHGYKTIISPHEWINLWVYGMEIWLVGYTRRGDVRKRLVFSGRRVGEGVRGDRNNYLISAVDLDPIATLFSK